MNQKINAIFTICLIMFSAASYSGSDSKSIKLVNETNLDIGIKFSDIDCFSQGTSSSLGSEDSLSMNDADGEIIHPGEYLFYWEKVSTSTSCTLPKTTSGTQKNHKYTLRAYSESAPYIFAKIRGSVNLKWSPGFPNVTKIDYTRSYSDKDETGSLENTFFMERNDDEDGVVIEIKHYFTTDPEYSGLREDTDDPVIPEVDYTEECQIFNVGGPVEDSYLYSTCLKVGVTVINQG